MYSPDSSEVTEVNGEFSTDISLEEGEVNNVAVGSLDNAGNLAVAKQQVKAGELKNLIFSGLYDDMLLNESDLVDGSFMIKGTASDEIKNFKINNKEVNVKDNYFNVPVKLSEGKNIVNIYAENSEGKVIINQDITLTLDTKAPELNVTPDIGTDAPYFSTNKDSIDLNVTAKDASGIYQAAVITSQGNTAIELDNNGNGKASVKLNDGLNLIQVAAV
ncbi:MAG: hypothetical protein PUD42_02925, partial [Clostridiales bacterium]|nr:hypothetical protein [Clostridiales bacterium]